jgi:nucleoside-diphosphate-sugar epimerase
MNWTQEKFLVTGATGFIGGRVCERLVQAGATNIRALVHSPHHAARIARLPIELCQGSLLDPSSLAGATRDATVIVHCGLGQARGIYKGTENLLRSAEQAKVRKFVHMSTAAVYGETPPPGCENETALLRRTGDAYCDNKARAERIALRYAGRGLPVVILRPSIVYGPYSAWNTRLIPELREGRTVLIDGGHGACNTTYIDNLVDAIFLSLENERANGELFFITDGEQVTWGDFIRAHAHMIGLNAALPEISSSQIREYYGQRAGMIIGSFKATASMVRSREFRKLLLQIPVCERVLKAAWQWLESLPEEKRQKIRGRMGVPPRKPQGSAASLMPDEVTFKTQTGSVFFSINKARDVLGYTPRINFREGMLRVEQWLRFANAL